ncbi:MAG: hypothetical protein V5A63_20165 [Bacteroides sp.]|uniref:hypothetical protein n=1 Tax=Bacteroides sp. TaxID=29523 RepID=UPI001BC407AB|nr:hypothetical protein [Candidatus Bipolaricaulota bacterium]
MKLRMASICLFLLILSITTGIVSGKDYIPIKEESWDNLKEWQRFNIVLRNSTGETLSIAGYYFKRSIIEDFYGGQLNRKAETYVNAVESIWPSKTVLAISVSPYDIQSEGYHFSPDKFRFSQDLSWYHIDVTEYILGEEKFFGGKLKAVTAGFIAIPDGINLSKGFRIWYEEKSANLGALNRN